MLSTDLCLVLWMSEPLLLLLLNSPVIIWRRQRAMRCCRDAGAQTTTFLMTSSKPAPLCRWRRLCDDVTIVGDDDCRNSPDAVTWPDDVTGCSATRSLTSFPALWLSTCVHSNRSPGSGRPEEKSKPQRSALSVSSEARSSASVAALSAWSTEPKRHRQVWDDVVPRGCFICRWSSTSVQLLLLMTVSVMMFLSHSLSSHSQHDSTNHHCGNEHVRRSAWRHYSGRSNDPADRSDPCSPLAVAGCHSWRSYRHSKTATEVYARDRGGNMGISVLLQFFLW